MLFTPRLVLSKPENGPGVDDLVDSDILGVNFDLLDQHIGAKVCTSATRPDNGANGIRFTGMWIFETDTKAYGIWDGAAWKLFDTQVQSYTPVLDSTVGGSPTVGNGTLTGRYFRQGKVIHFSLRLVLGTTTNFGTGALQLTLPFTPVNKGRSALLATLTDISASNVYGGQAYWTSAIQMVINHLSTNGLYIGVDGNSPFTWATTDEICIQGSFEAA
jgi:hypothetical protein